MQHDDAMSPSGRHLIDHLMVLFHSFKQQGVTKASYKSLSITVSAWQARYRSALVVLYASRDIALLFRDDVSHTDMERP